MTWRAGRDEVGAPRTGRVQPQRLRRLRRSSALHAVKERAPVGPAVALMTEGNGRFDVPTAVAIATGERLYEPARFAELIAKRAANVLQPDGCHVGGLLTDVP